MFASHFGMSSLGNKPKLKERASLAPSEPLGGPVLNAATGQVKTGGVCWRWEMGQGLRKCPHWGP